MKLIHCWGKQEVVEMKGVFAKRAIACGISLLLSVACIPTMAFASFEGFTSSQVSDGGSGTASDNAIDAAYSSTSAGSGGRPVHRANRFIRSGARVPSCLSRFSSGQRFRSRRTFSGRLRFRSRASRISKISQTISMPLSNSLRTSIFPDIPKTILVSF